MRIIRVTGKAAFDRYRATQPGDRSRRAIAGLRTREYLQPVAMPKRNEESTAMAEATVDPEKGTKRDDSDESLEDATALKCPDEVQPSALASRPCGVPE